MGVPRYFDLGKGAARHHAAPDALGRKVTLLEQLVIYGLVAVSIVGGRLLDLNRAGVVSQFAADWQYWIIVAFSSLAIFPYVYEKASLGQGKPILVQAGTIISTALGWEKLVAAMTGH